MSGNCKDEKLCGNTTPEGRSIFTQFRVFPIFASVDITVYQLKEIVLYFLYNITQRNIKFNKYNFLAGNFHVYITLHQHGS